MDAKKYFPDQPFYAVVCYPELADDDRSFVESYRRDHDIFALLIPAHFTLVFPTLEFSEFEFVEEVIRCSKDFDPFAFHIRCAVMHNDLTSDLWHVLLVPDEGFSRIVLLHDRLHAGLLATTRRFDLDFTPHIGIGNTTGPQQCKALVDGLNARDMDITGRCTVLDVVYFDRERIATIRKIPLGDGS